MTKKTITLREARKVKGWTMVELSEKSGIGWSMIQAIEQGRTPGNLVTRQRLCDALGYPLRQVFPESVREFQELQELMKGGGKKTVELQGFIRKEKKDGKGKKQS